MPDSLRRTENIWMFGKRYAWNVYESSVALDVFQYAHTGANPRRHQKNQICIHYTSGNGRGQNAISFWNQIANASPPKNASAHYIVELARFRLNTANPYSDVLEVVDSDNITWHGGPINTASIGIETTNCGWDWNVASGDVYNGTGAAKRPTDRNHYLHIPNPAIPFSNMWNHDFQYYEEEQYLALILLLRSLCIKHRIARKFLGDTKEEKFRRWWHNLGADANIWRSRLMRFRGILSHMNVSGPPSSKECGGPALHRNRLFRGIIDEWWPPVQLDGTERPYYMGPFDPQNDVPSYFRWDGGALQAELFHDANLDALQETKSYFDFDLLPLYYAWTEDAARGGSYPIGVNRIWHGGVHFEPPETNRKVYAAASGTIVAARLGGDAAVEANAEFGSQRFVLIRHCVYMDQEPDPAGGTRINYSADPHYVFTLYMHLAPFANLTAPDNNNPPWFNYWLRHRTATPDPNAVFYPDLPVQTAGDPSGVPVSVGDWIGSCGVFRTRNILHFEVLAREEFAMAPWNDANLRVVDNDTNLLCNASAINRFVTSRTGQNVDEIDIIRAAAQFRNVKSFHKSEWALAGPDALIGLIAKPATRQAKWDNLRHFMWVADAVAACPDLATQLCDATGMVWHYHPVTFMEFVNQIARRENAQISEPDEHDTNVALEDDFLTRFLDWDAATSAFVDSTADNAAVKPYEVSDATFRYHFSRADIACRHAGTHSPGATPPTSTRFSITLLDVIESARQIFGQSIEVILSHLCDGHNTGMNTGMCALVTTAAHQMHNAGVAVDIRPSNLTPGRCRQLWEAVEEAIATYNTTCSAHSGEPSRAELAGTASASAQAALQAKLVTNQALTNAEAQSFLLHIQLQQSISSIVWECHVRRPSRATAVRLQQGGIVGTFSTEQNAIAESAFGNRAIASRSNGAFEAWIKLPSQAIDVRLQTFRGTPSIIGVYNSTEAAELEKGADFAWPRQVNP